MAEEVTPQVPAAPAPEAPAPAVVPEAPAAPPAAPAKPAEPSPEDVEAQEWDDANKDLFPGLRSTTKQESKKDEPAKPTQEPKTPEAPETGAEGVEPSKPGEAPDEGKAEESDTSARDSRLAARETAKEIAELKSDVRTKMFADVPTELKDKDGDPIKTIDDVQKLINPRTGEAFTEDEAATWLLSAQQQFNEKITSMEKQIEQIAEVNLDLKDQADIIMGDYGELLKAMPDLRKEVWEAFAETLIKDEATDIIIKAPVSLQRFYKTALEPYAALARQKERDAAAATAAGADAAKAEAEAQAAADATKHKTRADRSDIYAVGKTDNMDAEEKEWNEAGKAVFGDQIKR